MTKAAASEGPTPESGSPPGGEAEAPDGVAGPSSEREGNHHDNPEDWTGTEAELEAERQRSQKYEDKYKRALADYANL